jgi:hypothetical protein
MLEKEEESKYGWMDQDMKDTGKETKLMEEEDSFMLMEMCMRVTGKMIRLTARVFTHM